MPSAARTRNPFFHLVALLSVVFVVTILALVAAMLGDPAAPVNRFLDRHGGLLIGGEVVAILFTGLLALVLDRRQTLRALRDQPSAANAAPQKSADVQQRQEPS